VSVREVADQLLRDLAPVDPEAAAALGRAAEPIMPRLAPEDFAARRSARERALRGLAEEGPPAPGDAVLADALAERLTSEIALDECGFSRSLLAPLATPVHQVREVFDALPRESAADWARVTEHLALVPGALRDYAATLRESAARGQVAARRQVLGAAAQCEQWIRTDDYYGRLAASGPADPALVYTAAQAAAATASFASFLRAELAPIARDQDGVGRRAYAATARAFLGEDVDLDETYAFGWDELRRITEQMRTVAAELGASSIADAAAALDADPAHRLTGSDQVLDWLRARVGDTVEAVDGTYFDLPSNARIPECRMSDASAGVMYYAPPDPALTRPGRIVWTPAETARTWREVTTVHHEGVPGHHLQIAVALTEAGLHPWQRVLAHVHGYAEGWAHYSEQLCDELGLLRNPAERLGMLFGQRWRAARIVIDMGLHLDLPIPTGNGVTDATRWSPELGVTVLRAASGAGERAARFEVERYFGWPAQALAFRIGARLWRQIRADAQRRPGFELRSFHMSALRLGPMGLGPLRRALLG
jgi:uncharacterized protein (DUF885 family)